MTLLHPDCPWPIGAQRRIANQRATLRAERLINAELRADNAKMRHVVKTDRLVLAAEVTRLKLIVANQPARDAAALDDAIDELDRVLAVPPASAQNEDSIKPAVICIVVIAIVAFIMGTANIS